MVITMNEESKKHIISYISQNLRTDGRKWDEFRELTVERGIIKTAEGSARVKLGNTEVIAGVKLGIAKPFADTPDEGILMVNAELLPLSSSRFEPGPPGIEAVEIARVIDRGIRESHAIDTKKLVLVKGEKVWDVAVDICPINDDGNLLDAGGIAAIAAIENALFPTYDEKEGKVDYHKKTKKGLPILKQPLPVTVYKIGDHFFLDPLPDEQLCYDSRLTITTTADGKLCALQKGGKGEITIDEVDRMVEIAIKKSEEIRKKLKI